MIKKNNKYIFETVRGDNFSLFVFMDKLPFSGASKLTSTIRRNADDNEKTTASTSVSGAGKYSVNFTSSQMSKLEGTYNIDLELSDGSSSGKKKTLLIGSLVVSKDITY